MIPAAALLFALAEPLVSLYRAGAFQAEDVPVVAHALRLWSLGLVFFACMMFVLRTFYSMKDTTTPMVANLALTPVQIGLYVVLTTGVFGWDGVGIGGIPIADGVFYVLLFGTLAFLLRRKIGGYDVRGVVSTFARMALASAVGGAVAWAAAHVLQPTALRFGPALLQVAVGGIVGLAVIWGLAALLKVEEIALMNRLMGRAATSIRRRRGN